eukprot:m.26399 g.26399  ORF g.26399 m.26399 type:complete len:605 (-) comp11694_c0_seq3:143-1957(-)
MVDGSVVKKSAWTWKRFIASFGGSLWSNLRACSLMQSARNASQPDGGRPLKAETMGDWPGRQFRLVLSIGQQLYDFVSNHDKAHVYASALKAVLWFGHKVYNQPEGITSDERDHVFDAMLPVFSALPRTAKARQLLHYGELLGSAPPAYLTNQQTEQKNGPMVLVARQHVGNPSKAIATFSLDKEKVLALQAGARVTVQFGPSPATNTLHDGMSQSAFEHLKDFKTTPRLIDPVAQLIREGPTPVPLPRPHRFYRNQAGKKKLFTILECFTKLGAVVDKLPTTWYRLYKRNSERKSFSLAKTIKTKGRRYICNRRSTLFEFATIRGPLQGLVLGSVCGPPTVTAYCRGEFTEYAVVVVFGDCLLGHPPTLSELGCVNKPKANALHQYSSVLIPLKLIDKVLWIEHNCTVAQCHRLFKSYSSHSRDAMAEAGWEERCRRLQQRRALADEKRISSVLARPDVADADDEAASTASAAEDLQESASDSSTMTSRRKRRKRKQKRSSSTAKSESECEDAERQLTASSSSNRASTTDTEAGQPAAGDSSSDVDEAVPNRHDRMLDKPLESEDELREDANPMHHNLQSRCWAISHVLHDYSATPYNPLACS